MGTGRKLLYLAWSLLVLALAYVAPYTLLAGIPYSAVVLAVLTAVLVTGLIADAWRRSK